ncbi:effector-associated constant component EACC1 [Halostreptopolyspora alba]|uniref:effector-associated constant component EACC1 n=1 Tax=Halostreptopolyspora alba TaxID=2487137 RepID=UPI0026CF8C12
MQIHVSSDAHEEDLAELVATLHNELLQLDVDEVRPLRTGPPPAGARADWGIDLAGLAVVVNTSTGMLSRIVRGLRAWCERAAPRPTIRLEIDGDVVEISGASAEQADQSLQLFLQRHGTVREHK